MGNIHINSNGEPGVCKAVNGKCPFGSADSHFKSSEEAEKGYASAQSALGYGEPGKVKNAFEGAAARPETKEEAYKIANIISNEGKVAVVTKESVLYIDDSEFPDMYEDEDGYEEALEEEGGLLQNEAFEDESWSSDEGHSVEHRYIVRAFDNKDQIKEYDNSKNWVDEAIVDVDFDNSSNENESEFVSDADFDSFDHKVTRVTLNIIEPKK